MSDRERWIVYPLLFLALAVSLRDKLTHTVHSDRIECRSIIFHSESGEPLWLLTQDVASPLGSSEKSGGLMLVDAQGRRTARFGPVMQCQTLFAQEVAAEKVIAADSVQTRGVLVADNQSRPVVTMGIETETQAASDRSGPIKIFDESGELVSQLGAVAYFEELHVIDDRGRTRVSLGSLPLENGEDERQTVGRITVSGAGGQPAIGLSTDASGQVGVISTHAEDRRPCVVIAANQQGGVLRVFDRQQTLTLNLGHFALDRLSGLVGEDQQGQVKTLTRSLTSRPYVQDPPAESEQPHEAPDASPEPSPETPPKEPVDIPLGPGPPVPAEL